MLHALTGRPPAEFLGSNLAVTIPSSVSPRLEAWLQRALEGRARIEQAPRARPKVLALVALLLMLVGVLGFNLTREPEEGSFAPAAGVRLLHPGRAAVSPGCSSFTFARLRSRSHGSASRSAGACPPGRKRATVFPTPCGDRMDLNDLQALMDVVGHGSFQAAAKALGVPRTKLRRHVDRLEVVLGAALVERSAHGVQLTEAGRRVTRRAGALLDQASELAAEATAKEAGVLGRIRLVVPVGMPVGPRIHALGLLHRMHPRLALDVVEADAPLALVDLPFDFMLHFGPSPDLEDAFSRVLMRLDVCLMASPAFLAAEGTPTRVQDLRRHRLLSWRAEPGFATAWPKRDGGTVPITPSVVSANPALLATLARKQGGIALLPREIKLFQPNARLVPVLDGVIGTQLAVRALSRQTTRSDPRLRAMIENIQQMIASVADA